jgi:hypothetical protein
VRLMVWLAVAQLRHRPGRWALLAAGIAVACSVPVIAGGIARDVAAQTVRRAISQSSPRERLISVIGQQWVYRSGHSAAEVDGLIDGALHQLSTAPIRRQLLFRQLSTGGSTFFLGAADHLSSAVHLISGRSPVTCTPTRCEVLALNSRDTPALARAASSLGIVVVGTASRADPALLSGTFDAGSYPVLVGDGVDRMAQLAALTLFQRTYGWVTQIDPAQVLRQGVTNYVKRAGALSDQLSISLLGVGLEPPDPQLAVQDRRASLSARRLGLLGGATAALLLGLAVAAAASLRTEHTLLVSVLRTRGAPTSWIIALTLWIVGIVAIAGSALGGLVGGGVAAVVARHAGVSTTSTLWHLLTGSGPALAGLILVAIGVGAAVLLWPDAQQRAAWRAVDLVALGCLAATVLAVGRGTVTATSLATRPDPLVVVLPALASLIAGLLAARLWVPATTLSDRILPGGSIARRIALLSAIRRPLRAVTTTALLAAAVCSVVFASAYRATLHDSAADQAAMAVPLDATLSAGTALIPPLTVTDAAALDAIAPGVRTFGVVRDSAVIRASDGSATGIPVLGLDVKSLPDLRRWSRTTGSNLGAATLATRLAATSAPGTFDVPAGARTLSIDSSPISPDIKLVMWFAQADGRELAAPLSASDHRFSMVIPELSVAARIVAITIAEDPDYATRHQHAIGEGNTDQPVVSGKITLGELRIDGKPTTWKWRSWDSDTARSSVVGNALTLVYQLTGQPIVASAPAPLTIPIAVDRSTAAASSHGVLALKFGEQTVSGQIVAELPRFPTLSGPFVLADRTAVTALLDRARPGAGVPSELWVERPESARTQFRYSLGGPSYANLDVQLREAIEARLRSDPISRGSQLLLMVFAGLALLLTAASLGVFVIGERRDHAGELYSWEADGVSPATLRRMLLIRSLSVVGVAVPIGVAAGLVLTRVAVTLIAVDASGIAPTPPLQVAIGAVWTTVVLAVALGLAIATSKVLTALVLREPLPQPAEVDLR